MFSLVNRTLLILFITILQSTAARAQESKRYRIEALVLRHLDSTAPAQPQADLTDYSDSLDFEERKRSRAETLAHSGDPFFPEVNDALLLPPVGPFPGDEPWAEVTSLEDRSERMSSVWRNLRLSESFRPEVFLAWEQPSEEPFPALHIHNDQVIRISDPDAGMRVLRPDENTRAAGPRSPQFLFRYDFKSGMVDLFPIPKPQYAYQLEGTIRLRRSRFLHIDLDLAFREATEAALRELPGPPLLTRYQGYLVHTLKQSRQVRTERMEYFDSPWLGVLLWISEIKMADEGIRE